MMSFKKRLRKFVKVKKEQVERGREVTLQMQAERQRKRLHKMQNMDEGAVKAIMTGLQSKETPLSVMKQEYHRRKYERERKKT